MWWLNEDKPVVLSGQLLVFFIVLCLPVGSVGKLVLFILLWSLTFAPLSRGEWVFLLVVNLIFSVNNILAVANNTFSFVLPVPDRLPAQIFGEGHWLSYDFFFLGVPAFEFVLWGFYFLHTMRVLKLDPKEGNLKKPLILALIFSVSFSLFPDQYRILLFTSGSFLLLLWFYHELLDLKCAAYMIFLGTVLEHLGVVFRLWEYPGGYVTGVAYWYINLFGGTGILLNRLGMPLLYRISSGLQSR